LKPLPEPEDRVDPEPAAGDQGALSLARRVVAGFAELPGVVAVALGGSLAAGTADAGSDVDLYVYAPVAIPLPVRAAVAGDAAARELDLSPWEPGDAWRDAASGRWIDVMYRTPAWIEDQLDRVLVRHEASLGYSTAFWHNVLTSAPLFDRDGWFARLQATADQPYPEALRRAIIATNRPLLRERTFSFLRQIEAAIGRGDAVAVQHRLTAFLAAYFDVLFAFNRVPHPGEKRQMAHALAACPLRPPTFAREIEALLAAGAGGGDALVRRAEALVDELDQLLGGDAGR